MKEIQLAFQKLNQNIIGVEEKSKGTDQIVKLVTTNKGKYIFKKSKFDLLKVGLQIFSLDVCKKLTIAAPTLILGGDTFLIESYEEGVDLQDANLTKKHNAGVWFEVGKELHKLHSKKMAGFGFLTQDCVGKFPSQQKYIESWFFGDLKFLKKTGLITEDEIRKVQGYYKKNKKKLNISKATLVHNDLADDNIIVKNNKFLAIIDWADVTASSPWEDFASPYIYHYGSEVYDAFTNGYGKNNQEAIEFYAFTKLTWLIGLNHKKKRPIKEMLQKYRNIIS
jgi:thiamine kinase-like enzyme